MIFYLLYQCFKYQIRVDILLGTLKLTKFIELKRLISKLLDIFYN